MFGPTLAMCLMSTPLASDTMNLNFQGGTVEQWVDAIKAATPTANIVVEHTANSIDLPAMQLQGVTLSAVMRVSDVQWDSPITCEEVQTRAASVWVVSKAGMPTTGKTTRAAGGKIVTGVFQLPHGTIDTGEMQAVIDAVRAVAALDADRPISIQVLPSVGLIAVRGDADQVETAEDVIQSIHRVQLRSGLRSGHRSKTGSSTDTSLHRLPVVPEDALVNRSAARSSQAKFRAIDSRQSPCN